MHPIDFGELYLMYLNGGAPVTDWQEVQEWARGVLRVEKNGEEKDDVE